MPFAPCHPRLWILLCLSALLAPPSHAGRGLGAETGPCLGAAYPSRYMAPAACRQLGAGGRDEAYSVVVGGSYRVVQGSEAEGRVHVGGDLLLQSGRYFNAVQVGVGACVVPPAADRPDSPAHLIVGGQIRPVEASATLAVGLPDLRSTVLVGGAPAGAGQVLARGGVRYQVPLPTAPLDLLALAQRSRHWASLPPTGRVSGQHPMLFEGDGQSALQVFQLQGDVPSSGLRLRGIPPGATVLINHPGQGTVSLNYYDMSDPAGQGGFQFSTELTRRLLWNFPQASLVRLTGGAQWQGSVLVAQGALYTALPGLNGRVLVADDLIQDAQGSELHNYDFQGDLPDPPQSEETNPAAPPLDAAHPPPPPTPPDAPTDASSPTAPSSDPDPSTPLPPQAPDPAPPANAIPLLSHPAQLGLIASLALLGLVAQASRRGWRRRVDRPFNESRGCVDSSHPGSDPAAH